MRWAICSLGLVLLLGCTSLTPIPQAPTPLPPTPVPTPTVLPPTPVPTPTPKPSQALAPTQTQARTPRLEPQTTDGDYFLGHADAPVTLEMFGDFQCPICGEFARTTEPPFFQKYVDTGKVKFVWRDFVWIGNESALAAEAARCAGRQGRFWAYYYYLFANQRGENVGTFSSQNLSTLAAQIGLEPTAFATCTNAGEEAEAIQRTRDFGLSVGIDVTPAFRINGDLHIGAPPLDRLSGLMDSYLARVGV